MKSKSDKFYRARVWAQFALIAGPVFFFDFCAGIILAFKEGARAVAVEYRYARRLTRR